MPKTVNAKTQRHEGAKGSRDFDVGLALTVWSARSAVLPVWGPRNGLCAMTLSSDSIATAERLGNGSSTADSRWLTLIMNRLCFPQSPRSRASRRSNARISSMRVNPRSFAPPSRRILFSCANVRPFGISPHGIRPCFGFGVSEFGVFPIATGQKRRCAVARMRGFGETTGSPALSKGVATNEQDEGALLH